MHSTEQPHRQSDSANAPTAAEWPKIYPATFAQQRLWFLDQLQPGNIAYLINWSVRLKGELDVPALRRALDEIVRRHQILRTTFAVVEGEVCQVVSEPAELAMPVVHLASHGDPEGEARRLAETEARTPLDLANGPVMRATLLRLNAREHALLLTLHHIFFDGSSRAVFIRDLSALYEAFAEGGASPLTEPRLQYGDYAAWQRRGTEGKRYKKLLAYWKKQLADAPAVLELPTDRPRPAVETFRGATKHFSLTPALSADVKALARKHGASLFMTLLTAFQCLLARYSNQDDIVVGVPVAGRTREEFESMIGLFANELAMRLRLHENATFEQLLGQMRDTALDAYEHQDMPLDRLILEINPERSNSRNPLFQVLFSMRNYHREALRLAGLDEAEISTGAALTSKFDLSLFITENDDHLSGWFEYNTDLFDEATAERMIGHLRVFLEGATANPGAPVAALPIMTAEERRKILGEFNDTAVPFPRERSLHQFIEEQVERTPDALALSFEAERLSYRELNSRSNQLAHRLRSLGVKPGDLVAVCATRSTEMVIALLGIVKSGGAYVPLDPDYPRERLAVMLQDSEPRAVLILEHLRDTLPPHSYPVISLDRDWHTLENEPAANLSVLTGPRHPAYMIYTSGSTGKPKGVPNVHEGIVNRLLWMQSAYGLDESDRVLQKTPYSFDVSVWEFFWPLMTGACLVVARPEGHKDPAYLVNLIIERNITTMHFVPSMLRIFLEAGDVERCTSLRRVICSGEALPFDLQERFFQRLSAELHNLYGPTEAAVDVTSYHCGPHSGRSVVPIGKPVWNTRIHILDKRLQPVPIGIAGELHIGGVQLALGYLKRPELTAEKFIPDPFGPELFGADESARLYKTGDLARYLADGNVEYLGRMDFQVKLRGFRIELGEIEAALDSHPGVRQSTAMVREDEPGDKRLVAYLVADPDYRGSEQRASHDGLSTEQVSQWATAFDEAYRQGESSADATFNIAGWNSSYTGQPIPAAEMRVWVETTVDRILSLHPARVLEIGCGTGLLLFRVAPACRLYVGTDISETALTFLRQQCSRPELSLPQVALEQKAAHEFRSVAGNDRFDTVILNSVAQYFPDLDYLVKVIERAVDSIDSGGALFIGDVRSLTLLRMFHASVQLHQAPDSTAREQLLRKIDKDARQEGELAVDPEFFTILQQRIPRIARVEIQLKRGLADNELTRFRYDVVLHIADGPAAEADVVWRDWKKDGLTLHLLREALRHAPDVLGFTRVPNSRLQFDSTALALLELEKGPHTAGEIREKLASEPQSECVEPEDLWAIEREFPYDVEIRASRAAVDGFCDVLLRRRETAKAMAVRFPGHTGLGRPWETYATNPLRQQIASTLIPHLRTWLSQSLPEYMIPAAFVVLDSMPLSPNGKVNRRALPQPEYAREDTVAYVAPRNPVEEKITAIWSEVLHVARIGIEDDFFALGGHSLIATQVISRVREAFEVDVPVRALFESPSVAGLAERVELLQQDKGRVPQLPLVRRNRGEHVPLSFTQERLWFLDQLDPGNPMYNITSALRFRGELRHAALEESLNEIVRRHEALRTRFVMADGEPVQVVEPWQPLPLPIVQASNEGEAQEAVRAEARKPFDLGSAPLIRTTLIRIAEDDHVLAVLSHHIVSDGWSFSILVGELSALYEAFAAGEPSPLAELPVQYTDFAIWQREHLSAERAGHQLAYWKRQLEGAPPSLDLPSDRPRPAVETFRGGRHTVQLPGDLLDGLQRLSRAEGVTLFMTLLGIFSVLLSRYSGQDDIVVGSPIAGRHHTELEKLIGLFLNTIVLRTSLEGNPTFRELLVQVRKTAMAAYAHQDLPFEKLIEAIAPQRDLSRNPVFQAMLVLQNMPAVEQRFAGARATPFAVNNPTAKFDLTLLVSESGDGLRATLEYNTDLFDRATIERMLGHYQLLLESFVQDPAQHVATLPLLRGAEETLVLREWNATGRVFPGSLCLHELFEFQVAAQPDAVALVHGEERVTYSQLNERANRIAHGLLRRGAGPDILIGIFTERTSDMLAGILGILKAGSAYVPLDPRYPKQRLGYILEDARASVVLTQQSLLSALPSFTGEAICLDADRHGLAEEPATNPAVPVDSHNLAYVLFTSGSTGRPKGVALEHHSASTFVHWGKEVFSGSDLAGVLLSTSICFDLSIFEIFVTLGAGGKIVLAENALELPALAARNEVTLINTVPSAIAELVRLGGVPSSVRVVNLAGEALPDALVEQIYANTSVERVYNLYGPTEDTTYSTYTLVERGAPVTIGRPLVNTQVYILDKQNNPTVIGVPGELCLAGDGLARGYYGRADLTAERFLPNPFSRDTTARMYRTGDLCRWLADGSIQYLGRMDHQVKLRGFRIELGEIENALGRHAAIRQSLVVVREDEPGQPQLVAYVLLKSDRTVSPAALRKHAAETLPDYMVPAAVVALERFPLTPNGKIDRKSLPAPEQSQRGAVNSYIAPRTATEEIIASIWSEILKMERVGTQDNFFELGGHSLLAMRLMSRIRNAFEVELPLRDVFEAPTVAALAERAEAMKGRAIALQAPPLRKAAASGPPPVSFAQRQMWLIEQLEPGSVRYNLPRMVHLRGALSVAVLERALNEVLRRHDVLRTTFAVHEGEPVQIVAPELTLRLAVSDVKDLDEARHTARMDAMLPFDLAAGPLLRPGVLRVSDEEHFLVLNMHHIVTERWSAGVFWNELGTLYDAFLNNNPSPLPDLTIQYADYSIWQRDWLRGEALETQIAYWRKQLQGAPPLLELPTDRPRPPVRSHRGASCHVEVSRDLIEQLKTFSRAEGATMFMTLLAAFQALLARYSGQEDFVVGSTVAGRRHTELESLIGFFVNTIALRADLSGDPDFRELLRRVKTVTLDAYAHQDVPFEKLVEELNPDRNLSYNPLLQVVFVQDQAVQALQVPGLQVEGVTLHQGTSIFDICWYVVENQASVKLHVEYDSDLFDEATIRQMVRHYLTLLGGVVEAPSKPVCDIPILSEAEARIVLGDLTAPVPEYPQDTCIHRLFEEQVERTPDRTALVYERESLTYRELNARANRLAHRLIREGAGPETLAGIWMERSLDVVVAILAVLKAGSGYLPLDPVYPKERLAFMLEDAQAPLLLTQTRLAADLPAYRGRVICVDEEPGSDDAEGNPAAPVSPENVIYTIYTSGSTGKPKGCVVTHANVARLFSATGHWFHFGPEDTWTLFHSYAFDFSVWEIWGALLYGGKLVIVPSLVAKSPEQFHELLVDERVTVLNQTPSAFRYLIAADQESPRSAELALRCVIFGGEALEFQTLLPWTRRHGGTPALINMYGITETTVHVTYFNVPADSIGESSVSNIGTPIPDLQVYVLDRRGNPVPPGIPGEIYVGGDGVARGYLNRPELTAERFIADTIRPRPHARLYKTGDLARFLADGNVQYLGRIDHQVKIRGFRIELGEIESVLLQHASVRECIVIDREDVPGNKTLAAYIVPRETGTIAEKELRTLLLANLPEYMVPAAFVTLEFLPLTPNGKVDRKALPAPVQAAQDGHQGPRTPAEEAIAGIWADVLRVARVGVEDNFFEIGGHSLFATQVVSRIRKAFQVEMPLRTIFESPTVAALAETVEELRRGDAEAAPPLVPVSRDQVLPLSFAQQRLWILDRLEPGNSLYNVPLAIRMSGPLDLNNLREALNRIVERHEVLRTVYREELDRPVQTILPAAALDVPLVDLTNLPAEDREREALRVCQEDAARGFDLAKDSVLRCTAVRLSPQDHVLLLNAHHIAIDGWSLGILRRELAALYEAAIEGRDASLAPLAVQYADYAIWQRNWLRGDVLARQLSYWRARLAGAPPVLAIPSDRPRAAVQTFGGATYSFTISPELADRLAAVSRREGGTLFMTLLAGFQTLLLHLTKQEDIVLGTDVASRTNVQTEALIGFFVNLLVIRTSLAGDPTFEELLGRVREAALGAYAHQDLPFDKLVEELHPERSLSHNPLVQVLFVQNTPRTVTSMAGIEWSPFRLQTRSKFDMAVFAGETPEGIHVSSVYNPDLFDEATLERMASSYRAILEGVAAEPSVRLSRLLELAAEAGRVHREAKHDDFEAASLGKLKQIRRKAARKT